MLPSAILPTAVTGTPVLDIALTNGPQMPETGHFDAILAQTTEAGLSPLSALLEALGGDPETADQAADLPEGGKDLPEAASLELPAALPLAVPVLLTIPVAITGPAAPLQPALDNLQAPAAPPSQPVAVCPIPLLAPGKVQIQPTEHAQVHHAEPAQLPVPTQAPAVALPAVTVLRDMPRQAAPPRAAATLRLSAEATPDKATPALIDAALAPANPAPESQAFALPAAGGQIMSNAPVTVPMASQAPHDFAQLIDRLVAARESAQPQAATLALAHADFGPVELRFTDDGKVLSVAVASADPDFARAVQNAVQPAAASNDSSAAQNRQQGQGGGNANSNHDASFGQPQGQTAGQNPSRRTPQDRFVTRNPGGFRHEAGDAEHGIFA